MSSNVGLTTPRGSGTSGYVQRNISHLKPRDTSSSFAPYPTDLPSHKPRKPDANILNHDRLRGIEVQVFELQEKLEDEGELGDEEVEERVGELRERLMAGEGKGGAKGGGGSGGGARRQFKTHQVHEQAEAKVKEDERLRRALGIRSDYEEGSHWRRNEERLREGVGSSSKEER